MPLEDKQAAELISRSLDQPLADGDVQQLDEYLARTSNGQKYVRMLQLQQKLARDIMEAAELGNHVVTERLSTKARSRIQQMLTDAGKQEEEFAVAERPRATAASQRQRDLAFASELLDSQRISPEQLSAASIGWEASGLMLREYLSKNGVVSVDACDILESRAELALQNTATGTLSDTTTEHQQSSRWNIQRAGVSAQVSQLLGLQSGEQNSLGVDCRFRLLRQIGEGGIGSVWLARDERLNRNVALKRLHVNGKDSADAIARFRREAEITGHLEHLNIIPVYLAGTDESSDKDLYVMRFVGKRTLTDAIREYHTNSETHDGTGLHQLLGKFLRVCDAIAYAHSRGVVHRDLKPDNIALDNFGQVIVLDWGLAKVTDDGELGPQLALREPSIESGHLQTLDGAAIGTPLYMSPEQAAGDIDGIDDRTDVYGLGALLFAILTGHAPHERSATSKGGVVQVKNLLHTIAEQDTPSPRQFVPDVPVDLEAICSKAMAFSQHARFESVTELSDEIVAWMAGSHQRQQQCDALRAQGRNLACVVSNCFQDMANNARFMGTLPPIQQIIQASESDNSEEFSVWRERLTMIFRGLLQANLGIDGVTYQHVGESSLNDLVRVERHSNDESRIRSIPHSRLTQTSATFALEIQRQVPDEAVSAISTRDTRGGLQAAYLETGISIFNEQTEEPFGNVIIEASLERLLREFLDSTANPVTELIVCDSQQNVLAIWNLTSPARKAIGSKVNIASSAWADHLSTIELSTIETEWTDEASNQFHIRRIRANNFYFGEAFILVRI
ncbi:MAG: serine/threonine-protein kinase [Fuerstiella sp.]